MKRLPDLYGWTLYLRGYKASPGIRAAIRRDGGAATARYLHEMLQQAIRDVPHYASLPRGVGDPFEQLSRMPILTKDDIRAHFEQLTSCDLHRRRWFRNSSGGSTGQPVTLLQDREYTQWSEGTLAYYFETFLGLRSTNVPKVVLWGAERDILARQRSRKSRLADAMSRTVFFNSFRMTPADLRACVETINHVRPVFIRGYAGSLYEVAQFIEREGLTVHRPRFIYSAAETLRPFMREVIEHAFECNVYDFYGSREVGPIAGECREGQKHLFTFHNVVEVVDAEGRPVGPGEEGRVLVTTLHNHVMPLIRYEIGDTAVVGHRCDCGSDLPTLARVTGRVTDHFRNRAGDLVHGEYFTHLFYFREWVAEFQVVQQAVDEIRVYYVPRGVPREGEKREIEAKIQAVMGAACRTEWYEVAEVPRTAQGKLLFTRSLVVGG